MANVYVDSAAAGAGTGVDWANAYTTLGAATAAKAAGDDFWVASSHAETAAAAKTITFPGTTASPNRCVSVNKAGSVPPAAADITVGATVTTTGTSDIVVNGYFYAAGIVFNAGTGTGTSNITIAFGNYVQVFKACAFNLVGTSSVASIRVGVNNDPSGPGTCLLDNCTVSFGNVSQGIQCSAALSWVNVSGSTVITGATVPTKLFATSSINGNALNRLSCLDLSALGAGKTIVGTSQAKWVMSNCKLGASVTVATTPSDLFSAGVDLIGCHSATNVERNERYHYTGTLTTETTIIRTAGASDGTTAYSWKIITTANSKRTFPFETFEGALWNAITGSSKTLTVHCITDNITLTDAEIWLEVEYLGSSATPVSTLITDANTTILTTATNQTSDSGEAWTTTGLTTPLKQALAVTFTPQMAGPVRWRVKVAKASTTVYVCPKADLS